VGRMEWRMQLVTRARLAHWPRPADLGRAARVVRETRGGDGETGAGAGGCERGTMEGRKEAGDAGPRQHAPAAGASLTQRAAVRQRAESPPAVPAWRGLCSAGVPAPHASFSALWRARRLRNADRPLGAFLDGPLPRFKPPRGACFWAQCLHRGCCMLAASPNRELRPVRRHAADGEGKRVGVQHGGAEGDLPSALHAGKQPRHKLAAPAQRMRPVARAHRPPLSSVMLSPPSTRRAVSVIFAGAAPASPPTTPPPPSMPLNYSKWCVPLQRTGAAQPTDPPHQGRPRALRRLGHRGASQRRQEELHQLEAARHP
jgi:hypothetical protein